MTSIGYALTSEERPPAELVANAQAAEEAGFEFALVSDHFHPWLDRQGESPFVWSVVGAIAQATDRLVLGTGVTCPSVRIHPAIVAQAAATSASLMPGRFFLGVGTGENLNEHVLGDRWPNAGERLEMLEQATATLSRDQVAEAVACGPDASRHREAIDEFVQAGFDHVCIHQVGSDQEGSLRFYEREVLPAAVAS